MLKGQEPDKRKFKIGGEERNSRQQLSTAFRSECGDEKQEGRE